MNIKTKTGIFFGLFMFVGMVFIFPYLNGEPITTKSIIIGIVIWSIAGYIFSRTIKIKKN